MTQTQVSHDPMAKVWGIVPRYMRERQAAEALALVLEAAAPKPAPVVDIAKDRGCAVDAVTADLRRRLATEPPRRTRLTVAAPALAGLAIVFGALVSH